MSVWTTIELLQEEAATPEVLNRPLAQLRARTDYLLQYLQAAAGDVTRQSLRYADVPLSPDENPAVGDVVRVDPLTSVFHLALATVDLERILRDADDQAYALGILVAVNDLKTMGTVLAFGYTAIAAPSALMADELFAPGPLFLSGLKPGKLTSAPHGPSIFIGVFTETGAYISPQYKDLAEAHVHRGFDLRTAPQGAAWDLLSGRQQVVGLLPLSTGSAVHGTHNAGDGATDMEDSTATFVEHDLVGLYIRNVTKNVVGVITANSNNVVTATLDGGEVWDTDDEYYIYPRAALVVYGPVNSSEPVTYTLRLADATGGALPVTAPRGFEDVWLHWASSDPAEGQGTSRVTGYELPTAFGTRGLSCSLTNLAAIYPDHEPDSGFGRMSDFTGILTRGWDHAPIAGHDEDQRTWTVTHPTDTRGWRQGALRVAATASGAPGHTLLLYGTTPDTGYTQPTEAYMPATRTTLAVSAIPAGSTLTVQSTVYEFTDGSSAVSADNVPVDIVTGDVLATLINAFHAIRETQPDVYISQPTSAALVMYDAPALSYTLMTASSAVLGMTHAGFGDPVGNTLVVWDEERFELLYWTGARYYSPELVPASIDVVLCVVPYDTEAFEAITDLPDTGVLWRFTPRPLFESNAYVYGTELEPGLSTVYPPTPLESALLVMDGLEVWRASYTLDPSGIYYARSGASPTHPWATVWTRFYTVVPRAFETGIVRSIRGRTGSAIRVFRCGTNDEASTGDLELDLDLSLGLRYTNLSGPYAVKSVRGQHLLLGPVVSRIRPAPGYAVRSTGPVPGTGDVRLILSNSGLAGSFEIVALENGKTDVIGMFPFIKLLPASSVASGFIARFAVPPELEGYWGFVLEFQAFGLDAVASAAAAPVFGLDFTYNVLRDYRPTGEELATLTDDLIEPPSAVQWSVALGDATDSPVYKALSPALYHTDPDLLPNQANRVQSLSTGPYPAVGDLKGGVASTLLQQVALAAGSQVAIRIRNATRGAVPYTGALGIMNLRWRLIPLEV